MITDYANQTLSWKSVSSVNDYNEPTYATTTVRGRKETGNKLVRNSQGEEVVSSAFVVTESMVSVGDLVDDRLVIKSDALPDLDGDTRFYEVYLS